MKRLACLLLALFAAPLTAGHELYVLKPHPPLEKGRVAQIDPETGAEIRVLAPQPRIHPLFEPPAMWIEILGDRLLVQGPRTTELDLSTGRMLRRYDSVSNAILEDPAGSNRWTFRGTAVPEADALALGIPPGIYGSLECPIGAHDIPCGRLDLPFGEIDDTWHPHYRFPFLLRRNLDPEDGSLHLVATLPETDGQFAYENPGVFAFDRWRSGFWRVVRATSFPSADHAFEQWSFFPVRDGAIGEEQIRWIVESNDAPLRSPLDLAVTEDALLLTHRTSPVPELTHRSIADGRERTIDAYAVGSVAVAPDATPEVATRLVPAIGRASGANGTEWRSDLWIFNPAPEGVTFRLRRVSQPERWHELTLPARGSVEIADVLGTLGGGPVANGGDGITTDALLVEAPFQSREQLAIYSRTYTPDPDGGSYGQAIPAVPSNVGYTNHNADLESSFTTSHFVLDRRDPDRFRHNLGVVNTTSDPLSVRLAARGSDRLLDRQITVAPNAVANVSVESLFDGFVGVEQGPSILYVSASRPAAVWMSMVDNRTGDATFVPFTSFQSEPLIDHLMAIPAVAQTPGDAGTWWRTDLYGDLYPSRFPDLRIPAVVYESSPCTAPGRRIRHDLEPEMLIRSDIDRDLSGCPAFRGAVELEVANWFSAWSRTYTTRPSDGGTFGEMLPLYPSGGWPVQHFSGITVGSSVRINLGLYNGTDHPMPHVLRVYDATGALAAKARVVLVPRELRQHALHHYLGTDVAEGLYGLTVTPEETTDGPGRSWAYVSIVDNVTGDPTNWW